MNMEQFHVLLQERGLFAHTYTCKIYSKTLGWYDVEHTDIFRDTDGKFLATYDLPIIFEYSGDIAMIRELDDVVSKKDNV